MTALDAAPSCAPAEASRQPKWIRMAGLGLAGLAAGAAAAALFGALSLVLSRTEPGERPPVRVSLGQVQVTAPAALVRNASTAVRLDLRLALPHAEGAPEIRIAVTLTPAVDTPAPETRVASLYPRFFAAEVGSGPAGLVRRSFRAGSPYAGEYVLFSVPDGRSFAARCETAGQDGAPPQCIAEFRRRGVDVQMRFTPAEAASWEAMLSDTLPRIEAMLR
jgi:hypothetical protein